MEETEGNRKWLSGMLYLCTIGRSDTPRGIPDTPKVILISPNEKLFIHAKITGLWHWN
jgi:hypothetical protein